MVLTTVPWLPGRRRRAARAAVSDVPVEAVEPIEPYVPADPYVPPLRKHGAAAATRDRFMDAVVLVSVLLFLILAAGIGVLVLRSTGVLHGLPLH